MFSHELSILWEARSDNQWVLRSILILLDVYFDLFSWLNERSRWEAVWESSRLNLSHAEHTGEKRKWGTIETAQLSDREWILSIPWSTMNWASITFSVKRCSGIKHRLHNSSRESKLLAAEMAEEKKQADELIPPVTLSNEKAIEIISDFLTKEWTSLKPDDIIVTRLK